MEITHKLPEWSSGKYGEVCTTEKDFGAIKVYYDIYQIDEFKVLASISHHCRSHIYPLEMVGYYSTLEEAKAGAKEHYNNLIKDFLEAIKK